MSAQGDSNTHNSIWITISRREIDRMDHRWTEVRRVYDLITESQRLTGFDPILTVSVSMLITAGISAHNSIKLTWRNNENRVFCESADLTHTVNEFRPPAIRVLARNKSFIRVQPLRARTRHFLLWVITWTRTFTDSAHTCRFGMWRYDARVLFFCGRRTDTLQSCSNYYYYRVMTALGEKRNGFSLVSISEIL